jgi:farnesyl-diphosphate farnesyltransferase
VSFSIIKGVNDSNKNMPCEDPWDYSAFLLQKVSRTFALNITVLPNAARRQVLLAYLYCRMADTFEDDPRISAADKKVLLDGFAGVFQPGQDALPLWESFYPQLPKHWSEEVWDEKLCLDGACSVGLFKEMPTQVQGYVAATVHEMSRGMAMFAQRQEDAGEWMALQTIAELDEYCYFVAGIVGNMLCDVFAYNSPLISEKRYQELRSLAVSFGLALQVTNILKDAVEDSTRGVCYLPEELAHKYGTTTQEMFKKENQPQGQKVIAELVVKAWGHLEDALSYTLLLPRLEPRMRLFCLWPLFMAAENLLAIGDGSKSFNAEQKVKITRPQVKQIMRNTTLFCASNTALKGYFNSYRKELSKVLPQILEKKEG